MTPFHSALVVNCCADENMLTLREFVWPIQRILPVPSKVVHVKKLKPIHVRDADVIVFSGCPLKDNAYLQIIPKIKWLVQVDKPMLGICAGQHVIGSLFGGKITAGTPDMGVHTVKKKGAHALLDHLDSPFSVYSLHGNSVSLPKGFVSLAFSKKNKNEVIAHRTKRIVGVSFHPEVLNKHFLSDFIAWAEKKK